MKWYVENYLFLLEGTDLWLSSASDGQDLSGFLRPYSPFKMVAYPVSAMVNNPKNEGKGCIKRVEY